jgi:thermitase
MLGVQEQDNITALPTLANPPLAYSDPLTDFSLNSASIPVPLPEEIRQPIPHQYILDATISNEAVLEQVTALGGELVEHIAPLNILVVRFPETATEDALNTLDTVNAEPDYYVSMLFNIPPSDSLYADQSSLTMVNALEAWVSLPVDAEPITVAVIDSGICAEHPDLQGRVLAGYDFVEDDAVPQDMSGHGCAVAGIISANIDNGIGIAGVAPNTSILPLRVLDAQGIGSYSNLAAAMVYAVDNGAKIINLSLGGVYHSSLLENAVNYAVSHGVLVVASAGNTGSLEVLFPAAYPAVIAVGAVDNAGQRSSFSAYGAGVDLYAPGENIMSLVRDGSYRQDSGTSMASAFVSAVAALEIGSGRQLVEDGGIVRYNATAIAASVPVPDESLAVSADSSSVTAQSLITVDTESGEIELDGLCSLPEAIINANDDSQTHEDCPAGSGADEIILTEDVVLSSLYDAPVPIPAGYAGTGLPAIESEMTINGNNHTILRDLNAPQFRILFVSEAGNLTLNDALLGGGDVPGFGGAIAIGGGIVTLNNPVIQFNQSFGGSGIAFEGGILSINGGIISANVSDGGAGGIEVCGGEFTMTGTQIVNNTARGDGGGIVFGLGCETSSTLREVKIDRNHSDGQGGGIWSGSEISIENSLLSNNTAEFGGAILLSDGALNLQNTTITENNATESGGAIQVVNDSNTLTIDINFSTFANNNASSGSTIAIQFPSAQFTIKNSILLSNNDINCSIFPGDKWRVLERNYSNDASCADFIIVSEEELALGALGFFGGLFETIPLEPGSVAIDAASDCFLIDESLLTIDQRGIIRPQGDFCDVGAFEVNVPAILTASLQPLASGGIVVPIAGSPSLYAPGLRVNLTADKPVDIFYSLNLNPTGTNNSGQLYTGTLSINKNTPGVLSGLNTLYFTSSDNQGNLAWDQVQFKLDLEPVAIRHIEVSQVIQNETNSVVLIANKQTFVRAYVECMLNIDTISYSCPQVTGTIASSLVAGSVSSLAGIVPYTVSSTIPGWETQRSNINATINFVLPKTWAINTQDFTVTVLGQTGSTSNTNLAGQGCCVFEHADPIRIFYIPITHTFQGTRTVDPSTIVSSVIVDPIIQWLPTDKVEYTLPVSGISGFKWSALTGLTTDSSGALLPVTLTANMIKDTNGYLTNWNTLNYNLQIAYGAWFSGSATAPNYVIGWLPTGATGDAASAVDIASGAEGPVRGYAGSSTAEVNSQAAWVVAGTNNSRWFVHELSHLAGSQHTKSGIDGCNDKTSSTWWNTPGVPDIRDYGLRLEGTILGVVLPSTKDYMTNCHGFVWTSAQTYNEIGNNTGVVTANGLAESSWYLISGVVYADDSVFVDPVWTLDSNAAIQNPQAGNDYCLEVRDVVGGSLESFCFDLSFVNNESGEATQSANFSLVLPFAQNATELVLRRGERTLMEWPVTNTEPEIAVISPNAMTAWRSEESSIVTVTWQASDADGDFLFYRPYYSHNKGLDWTPLGSQTTETSISFDMSNLAGGSESLIRVYVSDGVRTSFDDSEVFYLEQHAPEAYIVSPDHDISIASGTLVVLSAYGYDLEDGILDTALFSWSSDINGQLGTGESVMPQLSPGLHNITLTLSDSDSNVASDTIQIFVGAELEDTLPPHTTLSLVGQAGNNNWYLSDVTVSINAEDNAGGSGVAFTEWQLNTLNIWQPYTTSFIHSSEGASAISAFSIDYAGNQENPPVEAPLNIDKTDPVVNILMEEIEVTRVNPIPLQIEVYDPLPGSGLYQFTSIFNGGSMGQDSVVDPFWLDLGTYNFEASAEDYAGRTATDTGSIRLVATLESLGLTIDRLCNESYISNRGSCRSMRAKVEAAQHSSATGHQDNSIHQLNALLHQLEAQRGRHLREEGYRLLHQDILYVMATLDGSISSAPLNAPILIGLTEASVSVTADSGEEPVVQLPSSEAVSTETVTETEAVVTASEQAAETEPAPVVTAPTEASETETATEVTASEQVTETEAAQVTEITMPPVTEDAPIASEAPAPTLIVNPAPSQAPTLLDLETLILNCVTNNGKQQSLLNHLQHGQWDLFTDIVTNQLDASSIAAGCSTARQDMLTLAIYLANH